MNKLTILSTDSYEGLYVNDVLKTQSHEITARDIASYVPIESIDLLYIGDCKEFMNWFNEGLCFPENLPERVRL